MPRLSFLLLLAAVVAAIGHGSLQAESLSVLNAGFEEPALADGSLHVGPPGDRSSR